MKFLLLFFLILLNTNLIASDSKSKNESHKRKLDQLLDEDDSKGNRAKKAKLDPDEFSNINLDNSIDMASVKQDAIKKMNEKTNDATIKIFNESSLKSCLAQCENIKNSETELTIRNIIISKYLKQLKDVFKKGLSSHISGNKGICKDFMIKEMNIYGITCNKDATCAIIHDGNGNYYDVLDLENNRKIYSQDAGVFSFSHDNKYLLTSKVNDEKTLTLLKLNEGFKEFKSFKSEQDKYNAKIKEDSPKNDGDDDSDYDFDEYHCRIESLCSSSCNKYIAGLWADDNDFAEAKIWNIKTGKRVCKWVRPQQLHHIEFSPNGKYLVTAFCRLGKAITFSSDSKYIALIAVHNEASLWNKNDKSETALYNEKFSDFDWKKIVYIWDIQAKAFTKKIKFPQEIKSIKFIHDNQFLIVFCKNYNEIIGSLFFYNLLTDTLVKHYIYPEISGFDLDSTGNKLIMSFKDSIKTMDFSNSWIGNDLNLKQLMFVAKLILNSIDNSLSWKEFIDNFRKLPAQTGIELIQFVLPRLILENTKFEGKYLDLSKIISQYVGLHDDLYNDKMKALTQTIYPAITH